MDNSQPTYLPPYLTSNDLPKYMLTILRYLLNNNNNNCEIKSILNVSYLLTTSLLTNSFRKIH